MISGDVLTHKPLTYTDLGQQCVDATVQKAKQSKVLNEIHKSYLIANTLIDAKTMNLQKRPFTLSN